MRVRKQVDLINRWSFSFNAKIIKNAFSNFFSEETLTQSAALAYYMVFALPSILVIIFWLAGLWYQKNQITAVVLNEFSELMGQEGARQLISTLESLTSGKPTMWAAIIGVGTMLFMASTVFITIKRTLNRIFKVSQNKASRKGIWKILFDRIISISMIGIVAFIITLSITAGALITSFGPILERWMGAYSNWLLVTELVVLNISIHTILFAIAYRHLPDGRLDWRHIWFGALFSALLFVIGKSLIALFIANTQLSNFYDAAGSILMLMLWVFFSSAIFYFGAFVAQSRAELLIKKDKTITHTKTKNK